MAYAFPDTVQVSQEAKDLISKILVLDPGRRPTVDEILDHPFFHLGNKIPRLLPASTLACPPSDMYLKQFLGTLLSKNQSAMSLRKR